MKKIFFILIINLVTYFPLFLAITYFFNKLRKRSGVFSVIVILELLLLSYTTGIWFFSNIYMKYVLLLLVFFILVFILIKAHKHEISSAFSKKTLFIKTPLLLFFLFLLLLRLFSYFPKGDKINLSFPLKNGNYLIIQGGSNFLTNPSHIIQPGTDCAVDIVKISCFGFVGKNIFSNKPEDFYIFGDTIYSPCNALVIKTIDSVYDNNLFQLNKLHSTGNYILLLKDDIKICIAHIKQNSIFVEEGDLIISGEPIALAGNSGNSFFPHIHMHAIRGDSSTGVLDGEPVSMIFDNYFLSTNSIIIVDRSRLRTMFFIY